MPAPAASRRLAALAVTGALLFGVAACGYGDRSGSREPDDATITVYSGRAESLVGPLISRFEQASGIGVEVRYGNTAQLAAQLREERDRSPADLFYAQDAGALGAVAKAGLFAPLPDQVLNRVLPPYRSATGEWVGVTGRSRVMVYHRDLVEAAELPASVLELTDPRWRGRIGLAPTNGSFQAFVTGMRVQHGDQVTQEWLAGMAANDPQIRENNTAIVADVNAGRIDAGLVNHYYLYELAKEEGVPVDQLAAGNHTFPDGDIGGLVNVSGVGVLAGSIEDPDVRAFLDYLLSAEAQTYFTEQTFEYPMTGGAIAPAGLPELSELAVPDIDLTDLDALEVTVVMITESGLA